jgi:prepilin-type processing-associated H-X9-DG protein
MSKTRLKKRFTKRAAFTLLEVMVVTTIMTSQANNYGEVKRIAYQKSCQNNLRQIYMGLQMYEMTNGALPKAKFYPKDPRHGRKSIVTMIGPGYEQMFVCPVFPDEIKNKGLTYVYNDEVGGQTLDQLPRDTWIMTEMNAVSDKVPMPHPGGFHILYADGQIKVTKERPKVFVELQEKIEAREKEKASNEAKTP